MKDIGSNFGGDIGKISETNFDRNSVAPSGGQIQNVPHKEIKNLDNAHSALVGRSMVKKMEKTPHFDGEIVAKVKKDLAELQTNYAKNKKAVAVEDIALAKGVPYDKALKMGEEFRKA